MAGTAIRGRQIVDGTIQRHDMDVSTVGQAVVTKIIQGTNVTLSSTGSDAGTGDVTISATGGGGGTPTGSYLIGDTATSANYPAAGIILPALASPNPDAIWTYGAFDDHFDPPGSPNAKWVYSNSTGGAAPVNPIYTQAGSKLCLAATAPATITTWVQVTQQLPVQATHQITLKLHFTGFPYKAGSGTLFSGLFLQLEYGTGQGGVRLAFYYQENGGYQIIQLFAQEGASFGTYDSNLLFAPTVPMPTYIRFIYDASKNTDIQFSPDGITFMSLMAGTLISGSASGFATNAPTQWTMYVTGQQQSAAFLQVDWIKHV